MGWQLGHSICLHFCVRLFENPNVIYVLQALEFGFTSCAQRHLLKFWVSHQHCTSKWSDRSHTGSCCVVVGSLPPFWKVWGSWGLGSIFSHSTWTHTSHKMKAMCHKLVPTGRCHGFHIGRSSWGKEGPAGVVGVSHDHAEKCLMSCDAFGRAINAHANVTAVKAGQRVNWAQSVLSLSVIYHTFSDASPLAPV